MYTVSIYIASRNKSIVLTKEIKQRKILIPTKGMQKFKDKIRLVGKEFRGNFCGSLPGIRRTRRIGRSSREGSGRTWKDRMDGGLAGWTKSKCRPGENGSARSTFSVA